MLRTAGVFALIGLISAVVGVAVSALWTGPTLLGIVAVIVASVTAGVVIKRWERGLVLTAFLIPMESALVPGAPVTIVRLVTGLTLLSLLIALAHSAEVRQRATGILSLSAVKWWGGFLLWSISSVVWAGDVPLALSGLTTLGGIVGLMGLTALASPQTVVVMWKVVAMGLIIAVPLSTQFEYSSRLITGAGRFSTGGLDPNELAVLIVSLLAVMVLTLAGNGMGPVAVGVVVVPLVALAILTGSRTGLALLGILLTLSLVLALYRPQATRGYSHRVLRGAALGATIGLFLASVIGLALSSSEEERLSESLVGTSAQRVFEVRQDPSGELSQRMERWGTAALAVAESPIAGLGYGNLEIVMKDRGLVRSSDSSRGDSAHSTYLSVAAELGVVGFALFGAAVAQTVGVGIRESRRDRRLIGFLVAAGLILTASFVLDLQATKTFALVFGSILALGSYATASPPVRFGERDVGSVRPW